MSGGPSVSGIIIFLDPGRFIEEAIESVFAQAYEDWELLLVDDGSTDVSTTIAKSYAQAHPGKVRYLEHPGHENRGMSASRNLGVKHAKGEYVAFLDADDVWLPRKLEDQVKILRAQPEASMLYGRTQFWFGWTGRYEDIRRDYTSTIGVEPDTLVEPPTLLELILRDESAMPSTCSVLIRRKVLENLGGFEDAFRDQYEDMTFFAKAALKTPIFVAGECWDKYRQHPDKTTEAAMKTGLWHPFLPNPARRAYLEWLEACLSEQSAEDTVAWKLLQRELWPYRHPHLYRPVGFVKRLAAFVEYRTKALARRKIPAPAYHWLRSRWRSHEYIPSPKEVRFGSLRRAKPLSARFGFDRGLPVDRYYVERCLSSQASDIQGRVLEIGESVYTRRFGGDAVAKSDVLHVVEGNPEATFVGDLTDAGHIPSDTFDCIVITQTLHLIYDVRAAITTLHRILKPGGVVLATLPGITQISHQAAGDGEETWSDYWCWGFTALSIRRLFEEDFAEGNVEVEAYGNALAATAYLHGLATEELRRSELDYRDLDYDVLISLRAVKPEAAA